MGKPTCSVSWARAGRGEALDDLLGSKPTRVAVHPRAASSTKDRPTTFFQLDLIGHGSAASC